MSDRVEALRAAESLLRASCGDRVRTGYPLAPLTTFRIGGPAALYLEPQTPEDLRAASRAVRRTGIDVVVVGKGSNILVSDEGFDGLVLRLGKAHRWAGRDGDRLTAGGAMPLPALANVALSHGLSGLEFGVAIPGTVGGAVRMNAGAHGHSLEEVVDRVEVFRLGTTETASILASDAGFLYRGSGLPPDGVVVAATVRLHPGERQAIRHEMDAARAWRRETQPLAEPNCGSVFRNPPDGHAARLIEDVGGKGLSVGGATISSKHANFIVASPGARAADVATLMTRVQDLVAERSGVRLEPEVHLVGRFDGN